MTAPLDHCFRMNLKACGVPGLGENETAISYRSFDYPLEEIAAFPGIHYTGVNRIIQRHKKRKSM
jgi:hypothetical protein